MRCLAATLLLAPAVASATVAGLCTPSETVFFSCVTATKKWISLCGSESGAIQYRFGTPARIEFRFPTNPADAVASVELTHYGRFQVERQELTFINGDVRYTLFDYLDNGKQDAGMRMASPLIWNGKFPASAGWSVDSPNYAACCTAIRIMR